MNNLTWPGVAGTWAFIRLWKRGDCADHYVSRYRNFLITCAALMDQQLQALYFPLLDDRLPPSVRNLQHWLEDAWKHGEI